MEQYYLDNGVGATWASVEATKLIRKLRWIGLEKEAMRFAYTPGGMRPTQKGILAEIPYSTD